MLLSLVVVAAASIMLGQNFALFAVSIGLGAKLAPCGGDDVVDDWWVQHCLQTSCTQQSNVNKFELREIERG